MGPTEQDGRSSKNHDERKSAYRSVCDRLHAVERVYGMGGMDINTGTINLYVPWVVPAHLTFDAQVKQRPKGL